MHSMHVDEPGIHKNLAGKYYPRSRELSFGIAKAPLVLTD